MSVKQPSAGIPSKPRIYLTDEKAVSSDLALIILDFIFDALLLHNDITYVLYEYKR